jgi:hypothetical protein
MTHHRNFYFEKVSSREVVGGNQPRGPHVAQSTPRDLNVIQFARALPPDAPVNLRGGSTVSSFIPDERELGAKCFVAGLVAVVGLFLFAVWFVISNFVA